MSESLFGDPVTYPLLQEKWAELDRRWIEDMRQEEQERLDALTPKERIMEPLVRLSKLAMALTSGLIELIELIESEDLDDDAP